MIRERERVVATVVELAAGTGAGDGRRHQQRHRPRRWTRPGACARLGADYILSATPYYNKPTQEGLFRHFSAVADASTKPVCLYNVPGRTAVNLGPEPALRLAGHPNIIGIKEASGDLQSDHDSPAIDARRASPCSRATTGWLSRCWPRGAMA